MASRKHARVQPAQSGVSGKREGFLANIAALIDAGGQISVGAIGPIKCAAVANVEDQCFAMLQRRSGETLQELLERLDAAIDTTITTKQMIDEINAPQSKRTRRQDVTDRTLTLETTYAIVFFDCLRVKIRDEGTVKNKAVYLACGVRCSGYREVLGMWIEQTEGAKFWLRVMTEIRDN